MTIETPEYLFLLDEDLHRLGNATSSRLDNVRNVDVDLFERNGIVMVRANGKGISLGTLEYLQKLRLAGWLWKLPARTPLTKDLLLRPDSAPSKRGHFFLCPDPDMPLDKYRGLLSELALHCERTQRL